ncbi:MAG: VPLPA-CTERM sorting domain-containing protein [Halioglobus sp.]
MDISKKRDSSHGGALPLRGLLAAFATLVATAMFLPSLAGAATIYTLTDDGSSGGLGTGPYGTVTVSELNATDLHVLVDVTPNFSITRGAHHALTFSLSASDASIVIDNSASTNDFVSLGYGDYTNPPWGGFNYAIDCSVTSGPPSGRGSCGQTLEFSIIGAGVLEANDDGIFFAADIFSIDTAQTGAAGAGAPAVPVPAAVWLFGSALAGLVAVGRRRRAA